MKNKIKQLLIKAKTRLVISHLVTFIYFMVAASLVSQIFGNLSTGKFSEADAVRVSVLAWVGIAYANHTEVMRRQDALEQVIQQAGDTIGQMSMEMHAMEHSYNNLVETMDRLDKKVLRQHGISVNVIRKEKTVN